MIDVCTDYEIPKFERSEHHADDPYRRVLLEDFVFRIGGAKITIKAGFWWDGASIPRFFWRTVGSPFTGEYVIPTLIHDAVYATHIFARNEADAHLYEMDKLFGVGWCKNNTIYSGVRMGGWASFPKTDEQLFGALKYILVEQAPMVDGVFTLGLENAYTTAA